MIEKKNTSIYFCNFFLPTHTSLTCVSFKMILKWVSFVVMATSMTYTIDAVPLDSPTDSRNVTDDSIGKHENASPVRMISIDLDGTNDTQTNSTVQAGGSDNSTLWTSRNGRNMDFTNLLNLFKPITDLTDMINKDAEASNDIHSRILTGGGALGSTLEELASNTFNFADHNGNDNSQPKNPVVPLRKLAHKFLGLTVDGDKSDGTNADSLSSVKTYQPTDKYSSVSYSNPAVQSGSEPTGYEPSDLVPYYHDGSGHIKSNYQSGVGGEPVLYQLVPVKATSAQSYSFSEAMKDTLYKVKDHFSGTVQKVKNALGFNGFSEKVATPDTLLAVAPVAAGLLAGGLAVAYLAGKSGPRNNSTSPFNIFGKRSVRNVISEEDLNQIVARLDPVQREYLQKLQFYGPQRWKDVNCAKFIFCDVMSRATPFHVLDMQRKIGVFLSRMEESTARYVEVILKDVMLAIQARDCSRFSCGQTTWGLNPHAHLAAPPPPQPPPASSLPFHLFPQNNFLRRQ